MWILSLKLEPWLHDYKQNKSVTRIWEVLLGLTTWLQAKKKNLYWFWKGGWALTTWLQAKKKKCLLILNLVKAVIMVDYVTTSKKKMFIWILSLRLDLDYTTTSRKKKCLLILRGAVRVDYVTTGQKKKCLLILKGWMGFDYMTTSEKKKVPIDFELGEGCCDGWLRDYKQKKNVHLDFESAAGALTTRLQAKKKSVTRIWEMLLGLTTWLQAKKNPLLILKGWMGFDFMTTSQKKSAYWFCM